MFLNNLHLLAAETKQKKTTVKVVFFLIISCKTYYFLRLRGLRLCFAMKSSKISFNVGVPISCNS